MSVDVVVVDYGMGNVLSVCRAVEHLGGKAWLTSAVEEVAQAKRLVLPGVGSFADCMSALRERDLIEPIRAFVATGRPFLGICVGMQILFDWGEEFGGAEGLGLIPGEVRQISTSMQDGGRRKIPHIGWSRLDPPGMTGPDCWRGTILENTLPSTAFYFVHSFSALPSDAADIVAVTHYQGFVVTAAVQRANIAGVQFHPERSGPAGLRLLASFVN